MAKAKRRIPEHPELASSADPNSDSVMDALAARLDHPIDRPDRTPAYRLASRALDRIETRYRMNMMERLQLREALTIEIMNRQMFPELPATAPELWSDRTGRKENPMSFIRRVYAEWIGCGLKRSHLHSLDRALYAALAVWLNRHPEADFADLET